MAFLNNFKQNKLRTLYEETRYNLYVICNKSDDYYVLPCKMIKRKNNIPMVVKMINPNLIEPGYELVPFRQVSTNSTNYYFFDKKQADEYCKTKNKETEERRNKMRRSGQRV